MIVYRLYLGLLELVDRVFPKRAPTPRGASKFSTNEAMRFCDLIEQARSHIFTTHTLMTAHQDLVDAHAPPGEISRVLASLMRSYEVAIRLRGEVHREMHFLQGRSAGDGGFFAFLRNEYHELDQLVNDLAPIVIQGEFAPA